MASSSSSALCQIGLLLSFMASIGFMIMMIVPTGVQCKSLFQEIKGRQEDFMRAFNAGDAKGAAEVYAPEAYFVPNDHSPVKGRNGIEKFFQKDMADGVASTQIITEEVNGSGDWAFERGSYYLECPHGTESGAYLQVWKKINGVWLIHIDFFNVVQSGRQA